MRLAVIAMSALAAVFAFSDALPTVAGDPRAVLEPNAAAVARVTDGAFNDAEVERFLRAAPDGDDLVQKDELFPEERGPGTTLTEKVGGVFSRLGQRPVVLKAAETQKTAMKATITAWERFNMWRQKAVEKFTTTLKSAFKNTRDNVKITALKEKFSAFVKKMKTKFFSSVKSTPEEAAARQATGAVDDAAAPSLLTRLDRYGGKVVDEATDALSKAAGKLANNDQFKAVKGGVDGIVEKLNNLRTKLKQKPAAADDAVPAQSAWATFDAWRPDFLKTVDQTVKGAFQTVKGNKQVQALTTGVSDIADSIKKMSSTMFNKAAAVDETAAGGAATLKAPEKPLPDGPLETLGTLKDTRPKVE
ncbi:unnamed protein product [Hyaloperonospora brassicae]|uniref:RxLR effector candidate protein n=1 Tax=Hyaloperonospora brassicae TaxID=162125 RepID=A0AAV0T321_HYABA|nr:unnamed protein product [Hyaloperonospora brassicae]